MLSGLDFTQIVGREQGRVDSRGKSWGLFSPMGSSPCTLVGRQYGAAERTGLTGGRALILVLLLICCVTLSKLIINFSGPGCEVRG